MRFLKDKELEEAIGWMNQAAVVAKNARCLKAHSGTVIVKDGQIIGSGYNGPALDNEENRTCNDDDTYDYSKKIRFDKTCCIHAEWRAILSALKTNGAKIEGSKLYYCGLGEDGDIRKSGKPYCTTCSRLSLESGVAEFLLWHEEGVCSYPTEEYNRLSYEYLKK